MAKTNNEEWFNDDQARWFEEQRRDEEELRAVREASQRAALLQEVEEQFKADIMPKIDQAAIAFGKIVFRTGFVWGFCTALAGAVVFFFIS